MMPTIKSGSPAPTTDYTKIHNSFFRCILPKLTGSELAVCLVVINKTYGWQKSEDSISYSQFCKATGLALSTVEAAVEGLLEKGYISRRSGRKYKGLEKIYWFNPPDEKPQLSSIEGGKKTRTVKIEDIYD